MMASKYTLCATDVDLAVRLLRVLRSCRGSTTRELNALRKASLLYKKAERRRSKNDKKD